MRVDGVRVIRDYYPLDLGLILPRLCHFCSIWRRFGGLGERLDLTRRTCIRGGCRMLLGLGDHRSMRGRM